MSQRDDSAMTRPVGTDGDRPCVVILGGGFGGLNAAKNLGGLDCDVWLVDKQNHHLFQPLLYQVATAGLSPGDIATPIRSVLRRQKNTRVLLGEAVAVDRDRQIVQMESGTIAYDYLIVATGTEPNYFGPDEWRERTTPLKTIEDALSLRRQILYSFERAEQLDDPEKIREWLTFVIIGGGPTGVEMAGAIREIAAEVMVRDFRTIRPEETRVVLLDALPHILSSYPESLSEAAKGELEDRGVEVLVDSPVDDIGERSVTVGERTIPTRTVIWAAGVEPVSLVETLETPTNDGGRVIVDEDLTLPDDDRVYAIGDLAHFEHYGDDPLPGLAPVAIQEGKAAAKNIRRQLDGEAPEEFHYWDKGQMATIGRKAAVAQVGGWELSGFVAWLAWLFIHLLFLIGFRNKLGVVIDWAYSYIAFRRGARLIVGEPKQHAQERLEAEEKKRLETGRPASSDMLAEPSVDERAEAEGE